MYYILHGVPLLFNELIPIYASVLSIQYYLLLSLSWTFCSEFSPFLRWMHANTSRAIQPWPNILRESSTLTQQGAKRTRETIVARDSSSRHTRKFLPLLRGNTGKSMVVIRRRGDRRNHRVKPICRLGLSPRDTGSKLPVQREKIEDRNTARCVRTTRVSRVKNLTT